jgi:hypothetical protein
VFGRTFVDVRSQIDAGTRRNGRVTIHRIPRVGAVPDRPSLG